MKALITGASSGLGKEFAYILSDMGYDIIAVARREDKLMELKKSLKTEVTVVAADLSDRQQCFALFDKVGDDVEIVINNAGFGDCGLFDCTDINRDLDMIDLNITAVSIITKLFYEQFVKRNHGYILNVASIAGILPGGPFMAQYYATKAYVLSLTRGLYQEAKNTDVHISAFCPGPVDTEFNDNANVSFALKGIDAGYAARYAIKQMFKHKLTIVPQLKIKLSAFSVRLVPVKLLLKITSKIQKSKILQK